MIRKINKKKVNLSKLLEAKRASKRFSRPIPRRHFSEGNKFLGVVIKTGDGKKAAWQKEDDESLKSFMDKIFMEIINTNATDARAASSEGEMDEFIAQGMAASKKRSWSRRFSRRFSRPINRKWSKKFSEEAESEKKEEPTKECLIEAVEEAADKKATDKAIAEVTGETLEAPKMDLLESDTINEMLLNVIKEDSEAGENVVIDSVSDASCCDVEVAKTTDGEVYVAGINGDDEMVVVKVESENLEPADVVEAIEEASDAVAEFSKSSKLHASKKFSVVKLFGCDEDARKNKKFSDEETEGEEKVEAKEEVKEVAEVAPSAEAPTEAAPSEGSEVKESTEEGTSEAPSEVAGDSTEVEVTEINEEGDKVDTDTVVVPDSPVESEVSISENDDVVGTQDDKVLKMLDQLTADSTDEAEEEVVEEVAEETKEFSKSNGASDYFSMLQSMRNFNK